MRNARAMEIRCLCPQTIKYCPPTGVFNPAVKETTKSVSAACRRARFRSSSVASVAIVATAMRMPRSMRGSAKPSTTFSAQPCQNGDFNSQHGERLVQPLKARCPQADGRRTYRAPHRLDGEVGVHSGGAACRTRHCRDEPFPAAGCSSLIHSLFGKRLIPIGTVYDPVVCRGLDALNYACYQDARFMIVGTPSGVTLAPEGGAHQSITTPLIGMSQDGLAAFKPAFADELAVIMEWGLRLYAARWRG